MLFIYVVYTDSEDERDERGSNGTPNFFSYVYNASYPLYITANQCWCLWLYKYYNLTILGNQNAWFWIVKNVLDLKGCCDANRINKCKIRKHLTFSCKRPEVIYNTFSVVRLCIKQFDWVSLNVSSILIGFRRMWK